MHCVNFQTQPCIKGTMARNSTIPNFPSAVFTNLLCQIWPSFQDQSSASKKPLLCWLAGAAGDVGWSCPLSAPALDDVGLPSPSSLEL